MRFPTVFVASLLLGAASASATPKKLREDLRDLRDQAGEFSPLMGDQASKTIMLGERALTVGLMSPTSAMHLERQADVDMVRSWHLGVGGERSIYGIKVVSSGKFVNYESSFHRELLLEGPRGAHEAVIAKINYTPRGCEGKTWKMEIREQRLPMGLRLVERKVLRQTVENGAYKIVTLKSSLSLRR